MPRTREPRRLAPANLVVSAQQALFGRSQPKAFVIPYDSHVILVTIPLNLSCANVPQPHPTKHPKLSAARGDGRREARGAGPLSVRVSKNQGMQGIVRVTLSQVSQDLSQARNCVLPLYSLVILVLSQLSQCRRASMHAEQMGCNSLKPPRNLVLGPVC